MGLARRFGNAVRLFGVDPQRSVRSFRGLGVYFRNRAALKRQMANLPSSDFPFGKAYPCLSDRYEESGLASGHYFHQNLRVAQLIFRHNPRRHFDVGSRVDGFVAHVAAFRQIEVFDIRQLHVSIPNIVFRQRDIMQERPDLDRCTDSLSCLHALEHFGLGRYGDPVDALGYRKGWDNLHRMLEPGGKFYFSVPIGPQRIEFDAHRVFSVPFLLRLMDGRYRIDSFAYVNDAGELIPDADPTGSQGMANFGCRYGCGIFELSRL